MIYLDCVKSHSNIIGGEGESAKYHSVSQGGGGLEWVILLVDWMPLIRCAIYLNSVKYQYITIGVGRSAKYHSVSQGGGGLEGVNFVSRDKWTAP